MLRDLTPAKARRALGSMLAVAVVAACFSFAGDARSAGSATPKAGPEVTFCGYESLPGNRGRVFVELSELVPVEVSRAGQVIEYKLVGARVPLRNNRNPLLLGSFNSSALSAVLVPDKRAKGRGAKKAPPSVRLVITLRGQVSPSFRMVARGKGAALEVELPPLPAH